MLRQKILFPIFGNRVGIPDIYIFKKKYFIGLGIPHELDEIEFVNEGINNFALEFLLAFVVQSQTFCGGDDFAFSIELIDSILKNFICYFPNKVKNIFIKN